MTSFFNDQTFARGMLEDLKAFAEEAAKQAVEAILKPSANPQEIANVQRIASSMSALNWISRQKMLVTAPGALAGSIGGPWGIAAMGADLAWLGKNSGQGCLGVGYALGKDVCRDDIDLILAVWTGLAIPSNEVPENKVAVALTEDISNWSNTALKASFAATGKVEIKLGAKSLAKVSGKLAGKIIAKKLAVKGGSKLGAKLAVLVVSLASTKLAAKLAAKIGTSWLPILGGVVSGGINLWLIDGLLDSAYKYYTHDFIILNNPEVIDLA